MLTDHAAFNDPKHVQSYLYLASVATGILVQRPLSYHDVRQLTGTHGKYLADFEGLADAAIEAVSLAHVHLNATHGVRCSRVRGTFDDAPGFEECSGLAPSPNA